MVATVPRPGYGYLEQDQTLSSADESTTPLRATTPQTSQDPGLSYSLGCKFTLKTYDQPAHSQCPLHCHHEPRRPNPVPGTARCTPIWQKTTTTWPIPRAIWKHPHAIRARTWLAGARRVARALCEARRRGHQPVCPHPHRCGALPLQQHAAGQRHRTHSAQAGKPSSTAGWWFVPGSWQPWTSGHWWSGTMRWHWSWSKKRYKNESCSRTPVGR
jgi:hypothetical protein